MKKILIGLLIIAAGAAIYFLLPKQQKTISNLDSQKELLIGKWKLDSLVYPQKPSADDFMTSIMGMVDSLYIQYQYRFDENGYIQILNKDSSTKDSSRYEWSSDHQLKWRESTPDTISYLFHVNELNKEKLVLQSNDSTRFLFSKLK